MKKAGSVLAVMDTREVSGPLRGLIQIAQTAAERNTPLRAGMFVTPSVRSSPAIEYTRNRDVEVVTFCQRTRYDPFLIPQVMRAARDHGVSIFQSHGYKAALLGWFAKAMLGVPWIAFAHGYTAENSRMAAYNRLDRWLLRRADRVVAVSAATARLLEESGVSPDRVRVVHNAVDPTEFRLDANRETFRREIGVDSNSLLVGVVGRLSPEKGQSAFLDAYEPVAREIPNCHAVFVGEGQEEERLRTRVKASGLASRVSFAGRRDDMSSVYAALDLLVIPSWSEGLPNVLLEAMLHKRAVVATRVGGTPEVMDNGLAEFCVPPGDPRVLGSSIVKLLRQHSLREEVAAAGAKRVTASFSPSARSARVLALYKEVMARETSVA